MGCCFSKHKVEEPSPSPPKEKPTPSKAEVKPPTVEESNASKSEANAPTSKEAMPSKEEPETSSLGQPSPSASQLKAPTSKETTLSKEQPNSPTWSASTPAPTAIPSRRETEPIISDGPRSSGSDPKPQTSEEPTLSRTEAKPNTRDKPTPSRTEAKPPTTDEASQSRTEAKPPIPDEAMPKSPTSEECDSVFRKAIVINVDDLIVATEKQLENIENMMQSREGKSEKSAKAGACLEGSLTSLWKSAVKSGDEILELVAKYIPILGKKDVGGQLGRLRSTVATILEHVGKVHWVVGGLCLVAFLMDQIDQVSDNKNEAIRLLRQMVKLACHVRKLRYDIPKEGNKFSDAILMIFEGSILCASQLTSQGRFRMFGASVDTKRLNELESNINHLYQDLTLTVPRETRVKNSFTVHPLKPSYLDYAEKERKPSTQKEERTSSRSEANPPTPKVPTPSIATEPKFPTSEESRRSKSEPKLLPPPTQWASPAPALPPSFKQPSTPSLEELFHKIPILFNNNYIVAMENFLENVETNVDNVEAKGQGGNSLIDFVTNSEAEKDRPNSISRWASFLKGGAEILQFLDKQIQPKGGNSFPLFDARQALAVMLQNVGISHRIEATLSIIAYLLDQIGDVSDNQIEYIKVLKQMVKLTGHIVGLNEDMPEERKRFSDAVLVIFQGSMMCATLLKSKKFFGFLRDFEVSTRLSSLRSDINQIYADLNLIVLEKLYNGLASSKPPSLPIYPDYAVGITETQNQIIERLDMKTRMKSPLAVVIYGVGGIGKTTLANAVISQLDLKDYNFTGVEIHENFHKNDFKCLQEQMLKEAFPQYENCRNLTLRDCEEGRIRLSTAFQCHANKPVFIFIDNAHRPEDLQEILPSDLRGIPSRTRILLTTRNLGVSDVLQKAGLERREYQVNGLPNKQAKQVLLKRTGGIVEVNKDERESIIRLCRGIPLLLEIMGARLHRQEYRTNNCKQIVEALEEETDIRTENVTKRLVDFVYHDLAESTQQAFLDICCFFTNWSRRDVEYILGPQQVTLLEETALVKTSWKNEVIVHDVIRAIGIDKSDCSRIRDVQALEEAVKDEKVKLNVKGLWLRDAEALREYQVEGAVLNSMQNLLRVVALGSGITVSEGIQKTSKFQELRFLKVSGNIPYLPVDLESFERLAVYHGPLCIGGVNICQLPKTLRALKAVGQSDCTDLSAQWGSSQSMQIRQNSSLEELDLQELKSLERLPDSLDHLTVLQILLLKDCRFQVLPKQICRLSSLIELKLTSCKKLTELPSSFGELLCLKKLNLAECIEMKKLPDSFTHLSSLEILNLERCWKLEALPSSFGKLKNLKKLSLQSCALKELPSSFGELGSLTEFQCNCILLQEVPDSFERFRLLTKLDLALSTQLRKLPPSIEKLGSLEEFNLLACYMLEELPSKVVELPRLKILNLGKCETLKVLPAAAYRTKGKELTIILPEHLQNKIQ